jgi:hypothetical protein
MCHDKACTQGGTVDIAHNGLRAMSTSTLDEDAQLLSGQMLFFSVSCHR